MNTQKPNIKDAVLNKLESERIEPTAKYVFMCHECVIWIFWGASVLIGALAFAVIEYISMTSYTSFFEATHDSRFGFWLDALPYVWIGVFLIMVVLAYVNIRNTRRGYRYGLTKIIGSSLLLSVLGGLALQAAGLGYFLDAQMGKRMPVLYDSREQIELNLWQAPAEGRLVGGLDETNESGDLVSFTDTGGVTWLLDTMELRSADLDTLYSDGQVKVLGMTASTSGVFYACGVFPWMFDKAAEFEVLEAERQAFVDRMYAHKDAAGRLEAIDAEVTKGRETGKCATMPTIPRISESMQ